MTQDLVIIGCGGFGREVADVVDAINAIEPRWNLLGFIDDDAGQENIARVEQRGSKVLGGLENSDLGVRPHFVVGIGDPRVRSQVASRAEGLDWEPALLIHPTAAIGANVRLGDGSIVCAQAAIGSDVSVGRHVNLDRGSQVGHDSAIEDFVTAHPAAVVSGGCVIEAGAELGTNCTVLPGRRVGSHAVVGAAACVTRTVPSGIAVKGVPAR